MRCDQDRRRSAASSPIRECPPDALAVRYIGHAAGTLTAPEAVGCYAHDLEGGCSGTGLVRVWSGSLSPVARPFMANSLAAAGMRCGECAFDAPVRYEPHERYRDIGRDA